MAKKRCFHIDTTVIKLNEVTKTREIIPIKLLTPGDKILSYDPITKKQFFDSVLLMLRFTDDSKEELMMKIPELMMKIHFREGVH